MTGRQPFDFQEHLHICDRLVELFDAEASNRTVINRCFLASVMIAYRVVQPHVTVLPNDHRFYDEVERAVLRVTGDDNLMEDLKELRKLRVDADYRELMFFSKETAQDCLLDAREFISSIQSFS